MPRLPTAALFARGPLAFACALIVGACIVPGLDGEFKVDPNGGTSGGTSNGGTSSDGTSNGGTSSDGTSNGGTTSTTSSSTTSSSSSSTGGTPDSGGPKTFCGGQTGFKFCEDFTAAADGAKPWSFTRAEEVANGIVTLAGALGSADRHMHATFPAVLGNEPYAALAWTLGGKQTPMDIPLNKTLTAAAKVTIVDPSSSYANLVTIDIAGDPYGLSFNECANGDGFCFSHAGNGDGAEPKVTFGKVYQVGVSLTRLDVNGTWRGKVTIADGATVTVISETNDALPGVNPVLGNANRAVRVMVGAPNAGDNGTSTTVDVDDVLVTLP